MNEIYLDLTIIFKIRCFMSIILSLFAKIGIKILILKFKNIQKYFKLYKEMMNIPDIKNKS